MTCFNCGSDCDIQKTIVIRGHIVDGCEFCLDDQVQQAGDFSAKHRREDQKRTYRKDTLQPTQKRDFARAYPDEARKYYSDDEIRRF